MGQHVGDLGGRAPGTELGENVVDDDAWALVIGDPWDAAYVVEGAPGELREFVQDLSDLLGQSLPSATHGQTAP